MLHNVALSHVSGFLCCFNNLDFSTAQVYHVNVIACCTTLLLFFTGIASVLSVAVASCFFLRFDLSFFITSRNLSLDAFAISSLLVCPNAASSVRVVFNVATSSCAGLLLQVVLEYLATRVPFSAASCPSTHCVQFDDTCWPFAIPLCGHVTQ